MPTEKNKRIIITDNISSIDNDDLHFCNLCAGIWNGEHRYRATRILLADLRRQKNTSAYLLNSKQRAYYLYMCFGRYTNSRQKLFYHYLDKMMSCPKIENWTFIFSEDEAKHVSFDSH